MAVTPNGNNENGGDGSGAFSFLTEQSITTFAATTVVVRGIWWAFQQAGGNRFDSPWFGLLICAGIGVAMIVVSVSGGVRAKPIVFGIINTFVLWAAVLGFDPAATELVPGGTDPETPSPQETPNPQE